jgi:hypothetical protein
LTDRGIDYFNGNRDELASNIAQIFVTLKMAGGFLREIKIKMV